MKKVIKPRSKKLSVIIYQLSSIRNQLSVFIYCILFSSLIVSAQKSSIEFTVRIPDPGAKKFMVEMRGEGFDDASMEFKMPVWMPGYYQRMSYPKEVENFSATDEKGNSLKSEKVNENTWKVNGTKNSFILKYEVKSTRQFVASNFMDSSRAYIVPAGTFLHPSGKIAHSSTISIEPNTIWAHVVTGLDSIQGKRFTYTAPDFDILYDSPFLIGNLEELPPFTVRGIPHRFIGHKLGNFDREAFMNDLKKIVETSVNIFNDIPYKHYTFIAIGPGAGGIEHLNNTTVSFSGNGLNNRESRIRMLHFLAHEYFHHYNVKRIRPIELGPFDYDSGSRTKLLWISEGLSVYYEYLVVRRAGISTDEELLNAFRSNIVAFEDKPGKSFQTLEQASWETWSDGPFGRRNDEVNKTISYYDKGPVVGMLFDFKIRHATKNKRSLDDVMRFLYNEYYMKKKRGFTSDEFKDACEKIAGTSLDREFEYVSTTKDLDYKTYLGYAGLEIDLVQRQKPGAYLGITTRTRNDSTFIFTVDWESPAWKAGLRQPDYLKKIGELENGLNTLNNFLLEKKPGDKIHVTFVRKGKEMDKEITLDKKLERSFLIKPKQDRTELERQIFQEWTK